MHRALATPDVLALIVAHCAESKDVLAALARTCQVISECALDELWHTIDSVILLARCMPPRFWDELSVPRKVYHGEIFPARSELVRTASRPRRRRANSKTWQSLTRRARKGDWLGARFRRYAARIRDLSMADRWVSAEDYPIRRSNWKPLIPEPASEESFSRYSGDSVTSSVHPDVFRAWLTYSDNIAPLFSNLHRVWWRVIRGMDELELCPLIMRPALRAIRFGFSWQESHHRLTELIREAHARCPLLDSLDLSGLNVYTTFSPKPADKVFEVTRTIRMDGLHSFRCHFLVPAAFVRCLASLPNLRCFDVVASSDLTFLGLTSVLPTVRELRFASATIGRVTMAGARRF
jgi:hypothetical protein